MTQISYIHGIGKTDPGEYRDRAKLVPPQNYMNFTALTDGELRLTLLADQANILSAMYPENKVLKRSKNILVDALYKGVHNNPLPSGIYTGELATVVSAVRQAREDVRPAIGQIFGRRNLGKGIGDPLIPYEDCQQYQENEYGQLYGTGNYDTSCLKANAIKKILNDGLEKSSHHILYEFVKNPNTQPQLVAIKYQNHRATKETVSKITKLNVENMRLWLRNGVIRHNALKGAGPLQPENTIDVFRAVSLEEQGKVSGIGVIPVAVLIIQAIAAAVGACAALVAAFKQKDQQTAALWDQMNGIGTGAFGPQLQDWNMDGVIDEQDQILQNQQNNTGSGLLESDLAIPLIIGGTAYLLLK